MNAAAKRRGLLALATGLCLLVGLLFGPPVQAHLMAAQRGTLNIVGDGAYLVLSLPASAFVFADDDGDGRLSIDELRRHIAAVQAAVTRGVQLRAEDGERPLEGLMLSLSPAKTAATNQTAIGEQIVVMGRFALAASEGPLRLRIDLFGRGVDEQAEQLTVTRGSARQALVFTATRHEQRLFPPAGAVFVEYLRLGVAHILGGADHMLFLLLVLATIRRAAALVLALSCFTSGHAITLAAGVFGWVVVPAAVVEPAIAATLVAMAVFDLYGKWQARSPSPWIRLALVFSCSLIHGLGLAGDFIGLGLDRQHLLVSLAGFNLGIELAQLGVALLALALLTVWPRLRLRPRAAVGC